MRNPNIPGAQQNRNLGPMKADGIQNRSSMAKQSDAMLHNFQRSQYFADMKRADNVQTAIKVMGGVKAAAQFAQKINNAVPPEHKITSAKVKGFVQDAVIGAFKNPKSGGNLLSKGADANPMNGSYGLSKAPDPKAVSCNSGIAPNCYANDYMLSVTDLCAPLHINAVTLQLPIDANNSLSTYIQQTVMFDIQTRAQANVNFDLDITSKLSQTQLVGAFNAAINALQVYYYYASICSYESDPRNKNEGMINLRQGITSQHISDLTILANRLQDTPIPPRIVEWVRYMSMNFLSGNSQGAPIIKTSFDPTVMDTFTSPTPIYTALTTLNSYNNVFTLLRRAIPQWRVGKLYDVPPTPVFDKNFLTIFANLPSSFYTLSGTLLWGTSVANQNTIISYNSYNNKLDGMAFAMGGIRSADLSVNIPGLANPISTTTKFSRRAFYSVGGAASSWVNVLDQPYLVKSRQDSYQYDNPAAAAVTPHLYGAEKCQGVTGRALKQTAQNAVDFLFDINTIPRRGKVSNFNNRG